MKTLRFIGMALFAVLVCVNFAACSNGENTPTTEEQEFYTVKIGLGGELDVTYEPLSRSTPNDIYGIQVYSTPDKVLTEGENVVWAKYAYGLFDDCQNISITLMKGYKYRFQATMVVDAKLKIQQSKYTDGTCFFHYPFTVLDTKVSPTKLTNSFTISSSIYLNQLGNGMTAMGDNLYHPNVERFYGVLEEYTPNENVPANINMKRVSFGAKFIIETQEEIDGNLEINIDKGPHMIKSTEDESNVLFDIFSFSEITEAYDEDDYKEIIPVTFVFHKSDGATLPLGTHNITYQRNMITVVTVNVTNMGEDSNIGIIIDETESGDMTENGNNDLTIKDGEIVDTNVGTETEG